MKYKYAIRVLEERLLKERKYLNIFQRPTKYKAWQDENIETCLYRINELENAIDDLKKIKK